MKNTIEYPGGWEAMYNPVFNYTEFGTIKNTSGGKNFSALEGVFHLQDLPMLLSVGEEHTTAPQLN